MEGTREVPVLDVHAWHGEDREADWGFLDVEGKVVLDIGADYGSTAAYFLNKSARKVICIESYDSDYAALAVLAEKEPRIEAFHRHVASAADLEEFIIPYQPEVIKIDAEGAEAYLLGIRACVLGRAKQYGIELHNLANSIKCGNPRPSYAEGVNDLLPLLKEHFLSVREYTVETFHTGKWMMHVRRR